MLDTGTFSLAVLLLGLGLACLGLVWILARRVTLRRPEGVRSPIAAPLPPGLETTHDGVVVARAGGKVLYVNERARKWFGLNGGRPNLELLARQVYPGDLFYELFAIEGMATFSLANRRIRATSHRVPPEGPDQSPRMMLVLHEADWLPAAGDAASEAAGAEGAGAIQVISELSRAIAASLDLKTTASSILSSARRLIPGDLFELNLWDDNARMLVPYQSSGDQNYDLDLEQAGGGYKLDEGFSGWLARNRQPLLVGRIDQETVAQPKLDRARFPFRSYVGVPLLLADRLIGTLEMVSFQENAFHESDLFLLQAIAGQSAAAIDHARLYEQERKRADHAEGLRKIADLTASSASLEQMLRLALEELTRLLRAELGAVLLLDEARGELHPHLPSVVGATVADEKLARLKTDDPYFRLSATRTLRPFLTNRASDDRRVLPPYRPVVERFGLQSLLDVPLVARGQGIGEIWIGSRRNVGFTRAELQLASTAAGQIASAIERSRLLESSDGRLHQQLEQLTALTRVGRELNQTMDLRRLLALVHEEARRVTGAACATIVLFSGGYAAGPDRPPQDSRPPIAIRLGDEEMGDRLSALEARALAAGELVLVPALDPALGTDPAPHAGVHSALVAPVLYQGAIVGLIHLHGARPYQLDSAAAEITEALAAQLAIAVGNAQRFEEQLARNELLRRRAETLTQLSQASQAVRSDRPLEDALGAIAHAVQQATGCTAVFISALDAAAPHAPPDRRALRHLAASGLPLATLERLKSVALPWEPLYALLRQHPESAGLEGTFLIPASEAAHSAGLGPLTSRPHAPAGEADQPSHPPAFLVALLQVIPDRPLGLLILEQAEAGWRPDRIALEALGIFARQAAVAVENSRLYAAAEGGAARLAQSIRDLEQAHRAADEASLAAARKDRERSQAMEELDRRAALLLGLTHVTGALSGLTERQAVLETLAAQALAEMHLDTCLIVERQRGPLGVPLLPASPLGAGGTGPLRALARERLVVALGAVPPEANLDALLGQRQPLRQSLQENRIQIETDVAASAMWNASPLLNALEIHAFVTVPISLQGQASFVVLLGSLSARSPFAPGDADIFALLADQVGMVLEKADLLDETNRRLRTLNVLLDFSRHLSGLGLDAVPEALAQACRDAMDAAQGATVMLWDEARGRLLTRAALGFSENRAMLQIELLPDESMTGKVYRSNQPGRLDRVSPARDLEMSAANLEFYRQATDGRMPASALLAPLSTAERALGVLTVSNYALTGAFTDDDVELAASLARQAASAYQNARLFAEARENARQLTVLTNVSQTITSSLSTGQLVPSLLLELSQVLPYDSATLWLRQEEQLRVMAARGFEDDRARLGLIVNLSDSALFTEMLNTRSVIYVPDVSGDPRFPGQANGEGAGQSWLGVPLLSKGQVAGVFALDRHVANAYTPHHLQLAASYAGQAAVALENARLFEDSQQRALELDQRSRRLARLNSLSAALGSTLNMERILAISLQALADALNIPRGWAVIFDDNANVGRLLVELPPAERPAEITIPLENNLSMDRVRQTLHPLAVESVAEDPLLAPVRELLLARQVKSTLILPLVVGGKAIGTLGVDAVEAPRRFSAGEIELAQTIANQTAVAVQNARLYDETQRRLIELATINQISRAISGAIYTEQLFETLRVQITAVLDTESIYVAHYDRERNLVSFPLFIVPGQPLPQVPSGPPSGLTRHILEARQSLLLIGPDAPERMAALGAVQLGERRSVAYLGVPLLLGEEVIGVLAVQDFENPRAFNEGSERILSTIAAQLAVALENSRLYEATRRFSQELEQRVEERTDALARERDRVEALLRITTELSASLDLERVLTRALSLVNQAVGATHGAILVLDSAANQLRYRASLGPASTDAAPGTGPLASGPPPFARPGQELASWVFQHRQPAMIGDLAGDERWQPAAGPDSPHRSALGVPLVSGEDVLGVVLLLSPEPEAFHEPQLRLVTAAASQVASAISNSELYGLIRDQAERLGGMLRSQQVEASQSRAILEAVADGVLVANADGKITLFNAAAERILALPRSAVLDKPVASFIGVYGAAGQSWSSAIRKWSHDPSSYQPGDFLAERLTLEDRRVVSVHLAPVLLGDDFLGSVSIFRDITREVEVDRLKSEFVATVSHELRTPMTSIRGYVDLLLMGAAGTVNEQQGRFLDVIRNNADRLAILVNDLLDISRIEAGKVELAYQLLDLRRLAQEVLDTMRERAEQEGKDLTFEMDFPADLPPVPGDQTRVLQVIRNLVDNAFNYTPAGGEITLRALALPGAVQVDVMDTGIGLPSEEQARVFERFYRGEDPLVLATAGTGLGLSIVQHLVEMHGGRIWVQSEGAPGRGSTFSFILPLEVEGNKSGAGEG